MTTLQEYVRAFRAGDRAAAASALRRGRRENRSFAAWARAARVLLRARELLERD